MGKHLIKIGKRKCYICKNIFDLNIENFRTSKTQSGGLTSSCRECDKVKLDLLHGKSTRKKVIDKSNFTCTKCGLNRPGEYSFFDIDHIIPLRRNTNKLPHSTYIKEKDIENMQVLCPNCHREKTIIEKFRGII